MWIGSEQNPLCASASEEFGPWLLSQSVQGDFICRHHNEPRVQLYVPQEETFPISVDVTRSTHTNLDVMPEKRTDGYWNVDANRSLSDSWQGFTKFTV